MFEFVYHVPTSREPVPVARIDAILHRIDVPLPVGYREYLLELGEGELCDLLHVRHPAEVVASMNNGEDYQENWAEWLREGHYESDVLTDEDVAEAVIFADSAEGDSFFCCRRFGGQLFEIPRHGQVIEAVPDGFVGAARLSAERMVHDFPFFDRPDAEGRGGGRFDVRAGLGVAGFADLMAARWGAEGVRRSRVAEGETHPNLFVRPVGARFTLYLDTNYTRLPADCFTVVASYDAASESDVADFVASVALPGGKSEGG